MYFHEPTYDLDILARQNLHIHALFSGCAKREMVLSDIIKTAENAGLEAIAITDHIYREDQYEGFRQNVKDLREQLSRIDTDIKVYIGGELSAYGVDKYSFKGEEIELDYRLWAHNHYHVTGWEQPEDRSPESYKKHMIDTLTNLIKADKADCIAHPFHDSYLTNSSKGLVSFEKGSVPNSFTENEIGDLLTLAKQYKTAFELNLNVVPAFPEIYRRMYNIGKEIGAQFNIGTDAHKLENIDTKRFLDEAKKVLLG